MIELKTKNELVFVGSEEEMEDIKSRFGDVTTPEELEELIQYAKDNEIFVKDGGVLAIIGYNPKTIRH